MSAVTLAGGARTPLCRPGGGLAAVPPGELALAAAREALAACGVDPGELGAIVAGCAIPTAPGDLDFAAELAGQLGATAALPLTSGGLTSAGLAALAAGVALCARDGRPALVVAADSPSCAPLWASSTRHGAGNGDSVLLDPVGAAIARCAPEEDGDRSELDQHAARSHAAARRPPAERVVSVAGVAVDEPAATDGSLEALAALKPLFQRDGAATAGNVALPVDGAAALVLVAGGEGPRFQAVAGAAAEIEILESSAALLAGAGDRVNPAGGAVGQGLPLACGALVMALRLAARLAPGEQGVLRAGGLELGLSA